MMLLGRNEATCLTSPC